MKMQKPKLGVLLVALLLSCTWLYAQKSITGKITGPNGAPIEGATVAIKNTKKSTATNDKGEFKLVSDSDNDIIVVTYVGMERLEQKVGSGSVLNLAMKQAELSNLDDVVVVGYTTQKRNRTNGAIATIKATEIQDIPAPNMAGALRGRIAGLGVSAVSGRPGASITLNVRNSAISAQGAAVGATTEPLYVVDNMIVGKSTFDALDPSMVEDITILKDASAAIYGAAGAKGVVLVTTKRGKSGAPKLSYNGYYGMTDATRKPEMLSGYDHAMLLNETYKLNNVDSSLFFSEDDLNYLKNHSYKSWFDEVWETSFTQRHNLSLSGGSDKMTFFVGGAYQNANGNYAAQKEDKYTMRSGLNAKLLRGLSADINFNVDNRVRNSENGLSENDQAYLEALIRVPRWVPFSVGDKWVNNNNSTNAHPQGQIESGFYRTTKTKAYGINAALTYKPDAGALKGLTARFQVAQNASSNRSDEYRPPYKVYNFQRFGPGGAFYNTDSIIGSVDVTSASNSRLIYGMDESSGYRIFGTLQYDKSIGQHDFMALVGGEQSRSKGTGLGMYWSNQQLADFDYYWAYDQTPTVNAPSISESTKRSFFGRFAYSYAGKYTVDGIARYDASSNFAKGNIWGLFPTIGAGWVVSQEPFFFKNVKFINYLKLRANYGITGDDRINSRLWQERFRINTPSYLYANMAAPGLRPQIIPNPEITWEKKKTLNLGVDLAFFNNKLNVGVEVFKSHIYDAFDKGNDQNFPMYAGFSAPVINYQERYAWGSEFSIGYNQRLAKDLSMRASVNFGFSNSVVDKMFYNRFLLWENQPEDWQIEMGTDPRKYNGNNYGLITLGMFRSQDEVDAFLAKNPGYTVNGVVPQPGFLYFKDADGDGIITARDKAPMFETTDSWLATGIQLGLTYKSLQLSVNIMANFGGKQFYDTKARRSNPTLSANVPEFWTDRWTPNNVDGKFPRYDDPSIVAGWESTFWAVDGTTIRINDMTLAYAVPNNWSKKIGLSNARLLLTGNNLWVLKNSLSYKDPYSDYIYDYPTLRNISLGLSLGL
ncbi:MAG TPA: SusC/RagA family TonB-linked outer membrane protein [Phnomibacter sp.]|nr:SusC/RagA family TonB-linked outer membrane protein [Phnomibacter sp.]